MWTQFQILRRPRVAASIASKEAISKKIPNVLSAPTIYQQSSA